VAELAVVVVMTIFVGHSSLLSSLTFRTVPSERTLPAETVPSPLLDRLQFFFFWSRVVGSVVAFAIRQYLWRSQKIWIEFGQPLPSLLSSRLSCTSVGDGTTDALQISPLAGHVLIKNFRYHSANMSVRVLHGRISWRYWLWRVRGEQGGPNGDGEWLLLHFATLM
jgi:hypothetical protein